MSESATAESAPAESDATDVYHAKAKWEWLEPLCLDGGVNLAFSLDDEASWPIVLNEVERDRSLVVDVSAVPALAEPLARGDAFHLIGHVSGAMVRTAPLEVIERLAGRDGRVRFLCSYPEYVSTTHRRGTFRAAVRPEMGVVASLTMSSAPNAVPVEVRNLSLGGCLLAMRLADALALETDQAFERLDLQFPNRQALSLRGRIRHVRTDEGWTLALAGCEFDEQAIDGDRQLWYCVKEIEREGARSALTEDRPLAPSGLFRSPEGKRPVPAKGLAESTDLPIGNATARRLQKVADYLNAQILQLQNGGGIAATLLSRQADVLLTLGEQSADGLLYALGYLEREPALVQHMLRVAARASVLARSQGVDKEALKAITASALVHDLGKALLPTAVLASPQPLTSAQRQQLAGHVATVLEALTACRWLDTGIAGEVVGQINERLDGSGYPQAATEGDIGDIGRMMAVVDVIDALTQPRPDRPAWSLVEAYRHVLGAPACFDNAWAQRYIRRFGLAPVGALVRYSSGALAWVQHLDDQGRPSQVHMVLNANSPQRHLDQVLAKSDLAQLGRLEGPVMPAEYGLARV
ncbi:HD domain-containing phosphohydrolase [Salinicola avicenniae]|uniref:HD domain-containing phosphohydrolase n=1 Tax=Salinicola avicenniae TaxID=2916836 RepID=UPI002073E3E3|nr:MULTISPECIES: HD domain-containing phosphohydrolase [unclassified Salinicola]